MIKVEDSKCIVFKNAMMYRMDNGSTVIIPVIDSGDTYILDHLDYYGIHGNMKSAITHVGITPVVWATLDDWTDCTYTPRTDIIYRVTDIMVYTHEATGMVYCGMRRDKPMTHKMVIAVLYSFDHAYEKAKFIVDAIKLMHGKPNPTVDIDSVIFNDPATIVKFSDGDKIIVKTSNDDTYNQEKGFAMALSKKLLGDNYKRLFNKYVSGR